MSKESEFLSRLNDIFKGEAEEHRASLVAGLLSLEKGSPGGEPAGQIVERIFREAHSLKGAARAVNQTGIERLCQSMETIFSEWKKSYPGPAQATFDAMYQALDIVSALAAGSPKVSDRELDAALSRLADPLRAETALPVDTGSAGAAVFPNTTAPPAATIPAKPGTMPERRASVALPDTVRIPAARLSAIFLRAEDLLSVKQATSRYAAELSDLAAHLDEPEGDLRKRVERMTAVASREGLRTGERVDALLSEVRSALLQPFSSLLEPFARMVRDLALEEGKLVDWEVRGDDTRMDRRVLERIKDPLIHMVRNAVSHGIELPAAREALGKPRTGQIALSIERLDNDKARVILSDDGAGVDLARVKAAATAKGFLKEADALQENSEETLDLIFLSEMSTSLIVSDISGRGLGLAIARENIEGLGGTLFVENEPGRGASFIMSLPVSIATFRGVLVSCRGRTFAIPTIHVERVVSLGSDNVVASEHRDSLTVSGAAVALVDLGEILGLAERSAEDAAAARAVILFAGGARLAFSVDDILGEEELLAKSLGRQLPRLRNVSGATVMPGGEVIPILDPSGLFRSALISSREPAAPRGPARAEFRVKRILVADDSLTSRSLIKSVLESAGYRVETAVDGMEAFARLREAEFDLLVSDIEMPRMNGIALCEKVRAHEKIADLPVVLVTSLDSREDRERGIDAGANAYVAKSSFDQSSLLDMIKRLL